MSHLVVLVVDNPDDCPAILETWEKIGVTGITIIESTGLGRYKRAGMRDDIPLMPSLRDIFGSEEVRHRTLLSVVEDEKLVDEMIATAQQIIGNLEEGQTGFLFVVPVSRVIGFGKARREYNRSQD